MTAPATDLRPGIGFWGGVAIIVGSVIGSGVFRTPAVIASNLPDPFLIMALWVAIGIVSLCGALTMGELAALLPRTGGTYVYLRAAYGDAFAFVFGWLYLLAATPSGMAALSTAFGERLGELAYGAGATVPAGFVPAVGIGAIVLFSAVNIAGVRLGSAVQGTLAVVKVSALFALIGGVALFGHGRAEGSLAPAAGGGRILELAAGGGLAAAVAQVIFTYNGWIYVSLVAGEIREPGRRIGRMILVAMSVIIAVYVGANACYHYMLPPGRIAAQKFVAVGVMEMIAGPAGAQIMGLCIIGSILGALNGVILAKSRVPYALSRDGLGFAAVGRCHPRFATPYVSIVVQGIVATVVVLVLRTFPRITTYYVVVEWSALIFGIAAVFVLRRRMPDAPRPFRTPGYPWVPLVFVVGTTVSLAAIVWSGVREGNFAPLVGLGISLAGFPVYAVWRRLARPRCIGS